MKILPVLGNRQIFAAIRVIATETLTSFVNTQFLCIRTMAWDCCLFVWQVFGDTSKTDEYNSLHAFLFGIFYIMETINNTSLIRVAIVDDHKVVVEGFEHLINESGIATVVGKSYSASGCWKMLLEIPVDVLLLDVSLPDGNGMELCPKIKSLYPEIRILMVTSYSELTIIVHSLKNGASGYVIKSAMAEEIIEGISVVASGKQYLCDETDFLIKHRDYNSIILSRRERQLLELIVEGLSNNEIAATMHLGYETIKSYRKNLILKLNAHNTATLVKIAIERKLV
jgi:DNA-binding NarL/FixJ family response regulator